MGLGGSIDGQSRAAIEKVNGEKQLGGEPNRNRTYNPKIKSSTSLIVILDVKWPPFRCQAASGAILREGNQLRPWGLVSNYSF
jgi:hypothetical protein